MESLSKESSSVLRRRGGKQLQAIVANQSEVCATTSAIFDGSHAQSAVLTRDMTND